MIQTYPPIDAAWRSLSEQDLPVLAALAQACFTADGGLPLGATESFLAGRYMTGAEGSSIGAWSAGGVLLAAAALCIASEPAQPTAAGKTARRASLAGMVHPDVRGRGVGAWLMAWSLAQVAKHPGPLQVQLSSESLSPAAEHLYAVHGFTCLFIEHVMRFDLTHPLPYSLLPAGVTIEPWSPQLAPLFYDVYEPAFRERPGFPGWSAEEWIDWIAGDEDFRADLSLLAYEDSQPLAFIACARGWICQVGTHPAARGRGLASALMVLALQRMRSEGVPDAQLTVGANNPGALRLYEKLGFVHIGRRGRYNKVLTVG